MKTLASALLGLVGVLHLLPALGVLSAERLESLYGVTIDSSDLAVLMRHRAAMFAIVGGLMILGAVQERYRALGLVVGFASVLPFLLIAWLEGGTGPEIQRVVVADLIAVGLLLASLVSSRLAGSS